MEIYQKRLIEKKIVNKLKYFGGVLIEGPKYVGKFQTGKMLSKSNINIEYDKKIIERINEYPEIALGGEKPRLIDEWQYCPFLWEKIKILTDNTGSKGMYILSGSSTPKDDSIHHNGAGRIACIEMESMTLQEMGFSSLKVSFNNLFTKDYIVKNGSFDFSNDYQNIQKNFEYLSKGGFPESFVQNYTEKECIEINTDYLKQICRLNKKDKSNNVLYTFSRTMMEKIITELARLTGQELNISKIADITGYSKETVIRYIDILENMFIIKKLYCWMPHILSNSIILKTPKIYFFDPCLAVAALKTNSKDILEDTSKFLLYNYSNRLDSGFFFESQVLKQFRTFIECLNGNMYYYRDSADIEVDAVVEIDNNIAIFEIKVGGGESVLKGVKSLNKFRSILTDEEKSKITSYNIITCAGYSVYDVKNDINIISIDDLFLEQ